jgi:ubiquinone/menaquinone biosynthesis C-methylase UbiE
MLSLKLLRSCKLIHFKECHTVETNQPPSKPSQESIQLDHGRRMNANSAEHYDYWTKIMRIRYPIYMDLIKRFCPAGKMLDIGCGLANVWYEDYVKPAGYDYYCTDVSDEVISHMSKLLAENVVGALARKGQLEKLPWDDSTFAIVFASHILEHCQDIKRTFSEIKRVLKNDGALLFAVPCGYDDEPAHTHNREFEEWQTDFSGNGMTVVAFGRFEFNQNEFYGIAKRAV